MRRVIPPLNALRAFEVTARHMSMALAADELRVTPAAISHQIRLLEDHLGLPVFERVGRGLELTDAGRAGLEHLRAAFGQIGAAMDAIDALGETGVLNVSVPPSFASKWLTPRLDGFSRRHPEIDVHVEASVALTDFGKDRIDLAIRYGLGRYTDLVAEKLLSESVIPVCSPELQRRYLPFRNLAGLASVPLLHDEGPERDPSCPSWEDWLRQAGISHPDPTRGPRFNQSSLVIEAAVLGRGVALVKSVLAERELRSGALVRLAMRDQPIDYGYYIVAPRGKLNLPKVSHFRDWLRAEAADTWPALPEERPRQTG